MYGKPKELINWLYEQDKEQVYEIKKYKKKRNLDQNSKYYKLLNELALKLKISPENLHFELLKNYSQRYQIVVPHGENIRGIEYKEKKSIKKTEEGKLYDVYIVYTPSHELNTDEFSLLLSGLITECKEQGIETRSPDEILRDEKMITY